MNQLQPRPFFGRLINLFGRAANLLALEADHLQVTHRHESLPIPLWKLTGPPRLSWGLFGTTLRLPIVDGSEVVLRAAKRAAALAFSALLHEAWRSYNVAAFQRDSERISRLHGEVELLRAPVRYPAACSVGELLAGARAFEAEVLSRLHVDLLDEQAQGQIAAIRAFLSDPKAARDKAQTLFIEAELKRWEAFFDEVESKPLTPEQRLAVVTDEDATLILAGAGSGKTSVITAKAAYLVNARIRRPADILLLAFAADAAKEMSARLEERAGLPLQARTFHALAYAIIGEVEGFKPPLAPHATDDTAYLALIKEILRDLVQKLAAVAVSVIQWFAEFFIPAVSEWDFETKHEYYCQIRAQELRTLQGEVVKSYEELLIANWLYVNGIDYSYEAPYEHPVDERGGRRKYCPDFRLNESGVYIEHFGVRREQEPDGRERLTTAPFVKREEYLAGMDWKRRVHEENGTILIETFSYERDEGSLLSGLEEKLRPYASPVPRALGTLYDRVVEQGHIDPFSSLIGTFLRKFKSGGYTVQGCQSKAQRMKMGARAKAFLAIFQPVLDEYERRLKGTIDFEDMILKAADHVESGAYQSPYLHILVDEFQDISQSRARLVKALKDQRPDARLYGVGDDWQSIFRFAGSDIHLMAHFGDTFGGTFDGEVGQHQKVDLGRTFRSVDQIAFAAKSFVLKNPAQLTKKIVPAGIAKEPAIRVVEVERGSDESTLTQVLEGLASQVEEGASASVMLLGRYRFLEPKTTSLARQFPKLRLSFKTIHRSKGLEADHVVLLGAQGGRFGFPSGMTDDPLLSLVSPESEPYPRAEERRVMYVAMTRARYTLTILTSVSQPSDFVMELLKDHLPAAPSGTSERLTHSHRCEQCGGRLVRVQQKDGRVRYRCEHVSLCGESLPPCGSCETGLPRRLEGAFVARCECGAAHSLCHACEQGWMVERTGPYGTFQGCVRYPSCTGKGSSLPTQPTVWGARRT